MAIAAAARALSVATRAESVDGSATIGAGGLLGMNVSTIGEAKSAGSSSSARP